LLGQIVTGDGTPIRSGKSGWLGPLTWLAALPLAGAALIFWTAYRLQTSVQS
jgi:hypothetical protein